MKRFMVTLLGTAICAALQSATLSGEWLQYINGEYDGEQCVCLERHDDAYEIGIASLAVPVMDAAAGNLDYLTVLGGSFPHELIVDTSVMTDEDMFNIMVAPILAKRSQWDYDKEDNEYEYEHRNVYYEFSADVWPDLKAVPNRKWIILKTRAPEASVFGRLSLRIGLGGTDVAATLEIPIRPLLNPADFTRPVSFHWYDEWDLDVVDHFSGWQYGDAVLTDLGFGEEIKVELPEAGTLVLALPDGNALSASGDSITGNSLVNSEEYWSGFAGEHGFEWAYGTCARYQLVTVSGATMLTLRAAEGRGNIEFRRCFFYPATTKSVGISASLLSTGGGVGGYVTGLGTYKSGEKVVLTAMTSPAYTFAGWEVKYGLLPEGTDLTQSTLQFTVTDAMCGAADVAREIAVQARWTKKPLELYDTPVIFKPTVVSQQSGAWKKAQVVNGVVSRDGKVVGVIQVKVGKANKKSEVTVSGTIMGLDGKKLTAKGGKIKVTGGLATVTLSVRGGTTATVTVGMGDVSGMWDGAEIEAAEVGGNWTRSDAKVQVAVTGADLPAGTMEELLPGGEPVLAKRGKWAFNKASSVNLSRDKADVDVNTSAGKTNLSAMKLSYAPKTGLFKGSFKVYVVRNSSGGASSGCAFCGMGKKKLKKYTVNVTGVVADGKGYGQATIRRPAGGPWGVTVE